MPILTQLSQYLPDGIPGQVDHLRQLDLSHIDDGLQIADVGDQLYAVKWCNWAAAVRPVDQAA